MTPVAVSTAGPKVRRFLSSRREEIIENQYNEIKQLESRYKKLYEGSPVMFRTVNKDGIVLDCNQAYVNGLGYSSKNEVIGHSIFEHTPHDAISAKRESFGEWRRTGIVRNKEVWLKRKDGSKFPALINANNLHDDNGNLIGSNTVITDLTEIHRARKQLKEANEEIRKAYQMKEDFIRIAAHELRTPIQPILLSAELARHHPEHQEKMLDLLVKEAKRLKKIADDILDVSRIESDNLPYDMRDVRINEIITEVSNLANLQVGHNDKSSPVMIETKLDKDVDIHLDRTRITQALTNIVNNSVKFTKEGWIMIETCVLTHKKLLEIKISDTGTGIPQEMLPKLFGKFITNYSGDSANKHGTGLGLFISKSIIQAHGGDIFAYNNEDSRGATFVLRLPTN